MNEGKRYTEREMVLAKREAYLDGRNVGLTGSGGDPDFTKWNYDESPSVRYPLPKVTRPRVVRDGCHEWCCTDGRLQWRPFGGDPDWREISESTIGRGLICFPTPERIRLWYDLLTHPTEDVEAEE